MNINPKNPKKFDLQVGLTKTVVEGEATAFIGYQAIYLNTFFKRR